MSVQALTWAWQQKVGSPIGKAVLLAVANRCGDDWSCYPSQALIAKECELSERSTRDHLARLEQLGLLLRTRRRRKDGTRTSDLIKLRPCQAAVAEHDPPAAPAACPTDNRQMAPDLPAAPAGHEPSGESDPPPTPPIGRPEHAEGLMAFKGAYPKRTERPGEVEAIFEALSDADRERAIQGALGYAEFVRQNGRRRVKDQPEFLRDPALWDEFAPMAPAEKPARVFVCQGTPGWRAWLVHFAIVDPHKPLVARRGPDGVPGAMLSSALPPGGPVLAQFANDERAEVDRWTIVKAGTQQWAAWSERFDQWTGEKLGADVVELPGTAQRYVLSGREYMIPEKVSGRKLPTEWPPPREGGGSDP